MFVASFGGFLQHLVVMPILALLFSSNKIWSSFFFFFFLFILKSLFPFCKNGLEIIFTLGG